MPDDNNICKGKDKKDRTASPAESATDQLEGVTEAQKNYWKEKRDKNKPIDDTKKSYQRWKSLHKGRSTKEKLDDYNLDD